MIVMIKQLRKEKGLTQKELADKIGVSRQTFNAIENGKYSPTLDIAYKIAEAFDKEYVEEIFVKEEVNSGNGGNL
ncbi:helix-turn-helix transcriptional regulator [Methanobrevibacter sp. DSM 116169]|uniref:helix-turn-helix transcriptional regulator n=1 Tax=Methanobrevibacter sp. DSM 116169 TaxID=3242727 RepID=UPI0038FCFE5C